jgi:hypothetical protein
MSKLERLVSYESRLEMIILKQLDFDPDLYEVLPQPVVLHFTSGGKRYRHIPDYLAWRANTPLAGEADCISGTLQRARKMTRQGSDGSRER